MRQMVISGIRPSFPGLSRNQGQVTHVLLTRSPLIHPDASIQASAFDLHVLSTQPAFVLSQDQTLHKKIMLQYESQQDSQPDHGGDRSWPKIVSPEKQTISGITTSSNKHAIGFSNHKHTPITATQTRPRTLGASVSVCTSRLATRRAGGCLLYIVASIRATRSSSSIRPNRSRSERPSPFLAARQPGQQYTPRLLCAKRTRSHAHPPRSPGSNTGSGPPRRRSRAHLQATGSTSSGESLRTLPTALPTRCRVTLAGST